MGRKRINGDETMARFPENTFDRIDAVLDDGETRTDLIRKAVETLLRKRERKHAALEAEKKRKK
jgi:Arc/MetJ-type ribon-helix-helix transcriptional regulator